MKATELRIGNWVKIKPINPPSNHNTCEITSADFARSLKIEGYFNCYEPIPLTEEWLKRFGFEKHINGWVLEDNFITIHSDDMDNDVFIRTGGMSKAEYITCVDYVHQLQNLYFSLTGEELTLIK